MNNNGHDPSDDDPTDLADEGAELAVLGSILLESGNNMWQADFLSPVDFYVSLHATMFAKMRELYEQEVGMDASTVAGNDARLNILCIDAQNSIFTSMNLVHHATRVLKLSQKRQAVNSLDHMAQMLFDDNTTIEQVADYMVEAGESHRPVAKTATRFDGLKQQITTAPQAAQTDKVERKYIVEDFIRVGSLSIFYGSPGSLKSNLVMDMAMCVANGDEWLQRLPAEGNTQRTFSALNGGQVLWLNYDMAHDDVVERMGAMSRTYRDTRGDLGGENLHAISFSNPMATLTNEQQARELGRFLENEGYRMVVVDSLLDVKGKVELIEEGIGEVLRMWRFVAEEGECAVVIIAHNTKNSDTLYGSQFIKAKLDHLYKVVRLPKDVVCIEPEKQRSYGVTEKLYAQWTFQHLDDNSTLKTCRFWGNSNEGAKAVAVADDNNNAKLLKILKEDFPGRTFSNQELLEKLPDMTLKAIKAATNRLEKEDDNVHFIMRGQQKLYYYGDEPISDDE